MNFDKEKSNFEDFCMQIDMYVYFLYTKYIHFFWKKFPLVAKLQKLPKTLLEQEKSIFSSNEISHIYDL